jgi:apolipoprotein N-acyltransferase
MFNKTLAEFLLSLKNNFSSENIFKSKYFMQTVSVIMLVMIITIFGSIRLLIKTNGEGSVLKIGLIQPCISFWYNWKINKYIYLDELMKYTKEAIIHKPDLIIFPESAILEPVSFRFSRGRKNHFDELLLDFVKENNIRLLFGEIGLSKERKPQNNAVLINEEGVVSIYTKNILVPFGEWFPYDQQFPMINRLVKKIGGSSFVPGKSLEVFSIAGLKFGTLICYEEIFFKLCRKYRSMGTDFLINITNDGWTDYYGGHYQQYSASIFRAVENGTWFLRCGNTGVTAVINPKGEVINSLPILKKDYMIAEIDTSQNVKTIYSMLGEIILYIALVFIMILFLLSPLSLKS